MVAEKMKEEERGAVRRGEGKSSKIKLNGLLQFVGTEETNSGTEGVVRQ